MDLPEASMLNFFNKVLISLVELDPKDESCSIASLVNQCKSVVFGGQMGDYEVVLDHCRFSGLIQIKNDQVRISSLGQKFMSANRERYFEITEAQKQLLAEKVIFKGAWAHHARSLFDFFSLNQLTAVYELSLSDSLLPTEMNATVYFLRYLGILKELGFVITVDRRYSELVYHLTADRKAITEQQLEKILMENRKLGAQGENAVVEFERQRLIKLKKPAQAMLVKRISTVNTAAGYDIESFDGTNDEIFPNRFIEVKATTGDEIRFYWTNNEKEVANKKGDTYWIYMMTEFREDRPMDCVPMMIQNPEQNIPKHAYLMMEAHTFLIKEIADVEFTEHAIEEVRWYQLV